MVGPALELLCCLAGDSQSAFTGADAERAAILHSAQALGLERRFGSAEAGKVADLVVLHEDPLAKPQTSARQPQQCS